MFSLYSLSALGKLVYSLQLESGAEKGTAHLPSYKKKTGYKNPLWLTRKAYPGLKRIFGRALGQSSVERTFASQDGKALRKGRLPAGLRASSVPSRNENA